MRKLPWLALLAVVPFFSFVRKFSTRRPSETKAETIIEPPALAINAWTPAEGYLATNPALWQRYHSLFLKQTQAGNIDLLFLGDSITAGWCQYDVWQKFFGKYDTANYGIPGDTTSQILWRLDHGEVDGLNPKVVVLLIGINNRALGHSPPEIAKGIEACIGKLKEKLPSSKILIMGIFPAAQSPQDPTRTLVSDVNELLCCLPEDGSVRFIDIGEKFLQEDDSISTSIMPDFVHLSREGYRIWAQELEPTLNVMMSLN